MPKPSGRVLIASVLCALFYGPVIPSVLDHLFPLLVVDSCPQPEPETSGIDRRTQDRQRKHRTTTPRPTPHRHR